MQDVTMGNTVDVSITGSCSSQSSLKETVDVNSVSVTGSGEFTQNA